MGHWAEDLVAEVAQRIGGNPDPSMVAEMLAAAGREIEVLSGRAFHSAQRSTSTFEPNGLPLVDVPDVHVGSVSGESSVWEIPDPVNPTLSVVLQLLPFDPPVGRPAPAAEALLVAGELVSEASRTGLLSADYVLHWLANSIDPKQIEGLFRRLMDPAVRFQVPVLGVLIDGWWFQISRRLIWMTRDVQDEGRLVEPVMDGRTGGQGVPLAAAEPILIVARMKRHPVDWALAARIWPEAARRPTKSTMEHPRDGRTWPWHADRDR
jgi:hypothetical protein